jgi:GH24 family phage-related lysozyme (muramidase)
MGARAMRVSPNGLLFTVCREAIVLVAYEDGKHLSIGMGSNSPDLKEGDAITVHEALQRFKADIAAREAIVNRSLKVEVSQQTFDCLVDFYYQNANKVDGQGRPGFKTVVSLINAGDLNGAAEQLPEWHFNSAGEPKSGLKTRRLMEQAVMVHGDYGDLSTVKLWRGNPRTTKPELYKIQPGDFD